MVFHTEPGAKLRHADDQLAGADALGVDELEDRALVGGRLAAEVDALGVADTDVARPDSSDAPAR